VSNFFLGVGFGLVTASILALSAVGLTLQYAVSPVPNFAHGDIMTVGAYMAYITSEHIRNIPTEALAAAVGGALAAVVLNQVLIQPFQRRRVNRLMLFALTLAAAVIIENILLAIFGGFALPLHVPTSSVHHLGPLLLTGLQEQTIAAALVLMTAVHLLLRHTKLGKAIRAVANNRVLAEASGINAERVITTTWFIAGLLTGLSGYVLAFTVGGITPTLGFGFLFVIFAAAIVGGIDQPYGAMAGALLVGLATEISAFYIPDYYKPVVALTILVIVLLIRPQGIFGSRRANVSVL
jgi:neutral amino acid transport system permease protein